jgi:lipopolysaccharide export LptBFGC system permease protein LptF
VGQKFGDWLVFVSSIDGANYRDVALFSIGAGGIAGESRDLKAQSDKIIYAKNATLLNEQGSMALILRDGTGYALEEKDGNSYVKRLQFSQMLIRQEILSSFSNFDGVFSYWSKAQEDKKRAKDLSDTLVTAFFPLLSVYWMVLAGVYNPRQQKNRSIIYAAAALIAYYSLILTVNPRILIWGALLIPVVWIALSRVLFSLKFERVCASRGC